MRFLRDVFDNFAVFVVLISEDAEGVQRELSILFFTGKVLFNCSIWRLGMGSGAN